MWLINMMLNGCVDFWSADTAQEAGQSVQMNINGAIMVFASVFLIYGAILVFVGKPPAIVHRIAAAFLSLAFVIGVFPPFIPLVVLGTVGYGLWKLYRRQQRPPARTPAP